MSKQEGLWNSGVFSSQTRKVLAAFNPVEDMEQTANLSFSLCLFVRLRLSVMSMFVLFSVLSVHPEHFALLRDFTRET